MKFVLPAIALLLAPAPAIAQQDASPPPSTSSSPAVSYDESVTPPPGHKTTSGQVDQAISDDEPAPPPSGQPQNSDAANADLCRHLTAEQRKKNALCKTPH